MYDPFPRIILDGTFSRGFRNYRHPLNVSESVIQQEMKMNVIRRMFLALVAALVILAPFAAQAQVAPADVAKFMGVWTLGLDTPQGAMSMDLTLKGEGGKVAGEITSPMGPEKSAITDISKAGETLVLKYSLDMQGQAIPAKIIMTPAGEKMTVSFDFADGAFTMDGTATKK
jgi:hypothetical protein